MCETHKNEQFGSQFLPYLNTNTHTELVARAISLSVIGGGGNGSFLEIFWGAELDDTRDWQRGSGKGKGDGKVCYVLCISAMIVESKL